MRAILVPRDNEDLARWVRKAVHHHSCFPHLDSESESRESETRVSPQAPQKRRGLLTPWTITTTTLARAARLKAVWTSQCPDYRKARPTGTRRHHCHPSARRPTTYARTRS